MIQDWWLTPGNPEELAIGPALKCSDRNTELFLRRPPANHPEWRIDRVLQRKAKEGVKVYIIIYKVRT
jgi:phosphatidylserine/phosphatidylglycerophosphate/cardiolipin synthase-like enzyme